MMIVISIFFPCRNPVLMLIAMRFHLFDAMRLIVTRTLSLKKVGDSVLKHCTSSNPQAHNLALEHFPSTSFCLRTQHTDIVDWPLF